MGSVVADLGCGSWRGLGNGRASSSIWFGFWGDCPLLDPLGAQNDEFPDLQQKLQA